MVNCQLSILLVLDGCLHESHKQRMRVQYRTAVFRMELSTDKPFQCRNLYDFHQVRFGVVLAFDLNGIAKNKIRITHFIPAASY